MSLKTHISKFIVAASIAFGLMAIAAPANAQVLIVDMQRIQNESAAYKDFRLQTSEFTSQLNAIGSALQQGGAIEAQAIDLTQRKAAIGAQKYEEEMGKLRALRANYEQSYDVMNVYYQRMQNELLTQVQRAQSPILKKILTDRKAQIIVPKSILLDYTTGLDITTEVIESLDLALPTVTITIPQFTDDGDNADATTTSDATPAGESKIE